MVEEAVRWPEERLSGHIVKQLVLKTIDALVIQPDAFGADLLLVANNENLWRKPEQQQCLVP